MRNLLLILFIMCGWAFNVQAQCFLAYNEQNQVVETFCVGQRITFKDNTTGGTEYYDFDKSNGLDFNAKQTSFTFTEPGTYTVTQLKNVSSTLCERTFEVKAGVPSSPPVLQKLALQPRGLQLQIQSSAVNDVLVEQAASPSGAFTPVTTLARVPIGQSEHSITLASSSGCFRVRVINVCTGQENIISNTVCTQELQVTAGDRQNLLTWQPNPSPGNVVNYQLLRGGQPLQNLVPAQRSYTDAQVACGRTYTYQLVTLLQNGSLSVSLPVQVTTTGTTPPAAPLLLVSFNLQNQVQVETMVPAQETFKDQSIYRSQSSGVFGLIFEKQPKNAVDASLANLSLKPCYQTTYTDSCNITSARSNTACPVILTAESQQNEQVRLAWTTYEGFPEGVEQQTLELLDEQGQVYWTTPVTGQVYVDVQPQERFQRLTYRLLSKAKNASYQSYSNTASVEQAFQFYFPSAFTPNNDGLNDTFRAIGKFASTFTLQVLNRWGQVIFESKDFTKGWDGTYQGKPAPAGTYLYRFEATDVNGQRLTKSGPVTLVR
ncbi:T9SS type B sorting domain-containing protein [Nibribacter ruber]|uniref:T9SS type B sorting domain-containing protein n=1 Tax=Nibribacter ruber TaxID=2698458 RepID=A0A6P1NWY1_9BACT|nr:gliding motility-associated C-terminal domain-containing protein [Nibribacter ruber]QHL86141.1 T9SS type B sorting domain-containing protein [Nibribacter ruber]